MKVFVQVPCLNEETTLSAVLASNQTFDERAEAEALNGRWR